jgi:hypothetical protein
VALSIFLGTHRARSRDTLIEKFRWVRIGVACDAPRVMPHDMVIEGERFPVRDVTEIARGCTRPLLRAHRTSAGDLVVIAATSATRDGAPLLGNLAVVAWGTSALLRIGDRRVEAAWRDAEERRAAAAGERCRLCFGPFASDEAAVVCRCACVFHEDCNLARVDCPSCGAPREGGDA